MWMVEHVTPDFGQMKSTAISWVPYIHSLGEEDPACHAGCTGIILGSGKDNPAVGSSLRSIKRARFPLLPPGACYWLVWMILILVSVGWQGIETHYSGISRHVLGLLDKLSGLARGLLLQEQNGEVSLWLHHLSLLDCTRWQGSPFYSALILSMNTYIAYPPPWKAEHRTLTKQSTVFITTSLGMLLLVFRAACGRSVKTIHKPFATFCFGFNQDISECVSAIRSIHSIHCWKQGNE